jgi:hypothetical protein
VAPAGEKLHGDTIRKLMYLTKVVSLQTSTFPYPLLRNSQVDVRQVALR